MRAPLRVGLLLGLALLLPAAALAQQASFQGLGDLPGGAFSSVAYDVSADGSVVVGYSDGAEGPAGVPFRWTDAGGMMSLPFLPGSNWATARSVSDDGTVIVGNGANVALRWVQGAVAQLGSLGNPAPNDGANGVSGDGLVAVGTSIEGTGAVRAVRWAPDVQVIPGANAGSFASAVSRDGSTVVGSQSGGVIGLPFRWTAGGGLALLPLLPDGQGAVALDVSADGSVVAGYGRDAQGVYEAFVWTAATNMTRGLGDLPGGLFQSFAQGISADGSVVVGRSTSASGDEAFIWTEGAGMRSVRAALVALGLDLTGWTLTTAIKTSADGTVIVGSGTNPQGQTEAWRAVLPRFALLAPAAGALVVGGERTRVRWAAPASLGLLELVLLPDTLGAPPVTLDFGLAPADTAYAWAVPDTLFSRSARLVLRVMTDPAVADTSAYFRIKPYRLTRLTAGGARYEPFRPARHGWPFGNVQADLFPPAWYGLPPFDYAGGTDPFTLSEYDADFPAPPINARPDVFADWPAFVRAFGTDAAYHLVVPGVEAWYRDAFTAAWGAFHGGSAWGGSCYGIATSSLLAFTHRAAFGARYPAVGPVERLYAVGMSAPVRELVNEQYGHQRGRLARAAQATRLLDGPRVALAMLKAALREDEATPNLSALSLKNVTSCAPFASSGGHAVTPYRLERDPSGPGRWRVYVYDSNLPGDSTAFVAVDSTANQWAYAGGLNWGGACGLFLRDPIANYLDLALVDPLGGPDAPGLRDGGDALHVAAAPGASVRLASGAGAVGYANGAVFNTLPGAVPDVPDVGGPAPPTGYDVPPGAYALTLSAFPSQRASAYVFAPGAVYAYGRADADSAHTDRLTYNPSAGLGGGLTAASRDAGVTKAVTLRAVLPGAAGGPERTLEAAALALVGADSVAFAAVDDPAGPRLRLQNPGGAKTYTLRLRQADGGGGARFRHVAVPLAAGATHTVRPVWAALGSGPVEVDVDLDGDGVPDEVLVLVNEPVAAEPGAPAADPPAVLALHPPAPNPATGRATLRYDLPTAGRVRLALYDALGREVAVVVDGERPAGAHEAVLEAGRLAPGTYLLRLEAGPATVTRPLTVAR